MSSGKDREHPHEPRHSSSTKRSRSSRFDPGGLSSSPRSSSLSVSTSTMPKTNPESSVESKKRSRSFFRPMIRSVVPETNLLARAQRPSQTGRIGESIVVLSNHFRIDFGENFSEKMIYQFDIDVEVLLRHGTWRSCRKDERLQVLNILIEREKFPFVWFDQGKTLYALENLTLKLKKEYQCELTNEKTNRTNRFRFLLINLVRTHELKDLHQYIQGKTSIRPQDSVRILEILFKQYQRSEMIGIKDRFYLKNQRLEDLGDGRGLASGYHQSIVLGRSGPTLNLNNTFTCFYQAWNLIEFLSSYLGRDIRRHGIPPNDRPLLIRKVLKPIWFVTNHTNQTRKYRVKSFGQSADEHQFLQERTEDQGTKITVREYFRNKWNIRLRYPELPVLQLFNPIDPNQFSYLPIELVQIDAWQRSLKPLTIEQKAKVSKTTIVPPGKRLDNLRRIVDDRRFNEDIYLKQCGIKVVTNDFLKISARILPPPDIKYRSSDRDQREVIEKVQIGKWHLNRSFNRPREIRVWATILISQHEPDEQQIRIAKDFISRIPQLMSRYGIIFHRHPIEISDAAVPDTILARMYQLQREKCEVIIYMLNHVDDAIYHAIKYYGNIQLGMVTQCTRFEKISANLEPRKMENYVQNLVQKFNAKLGGINQLVSLTKILISSTTRPDTFMFFGIDCTRITCSKERPSIAAIVGSKDSTSTQYMARVIQQYSEKGKIAVEIIKDLHIYVGELLKEFSLENSTLPTKLVFYRSGVGDGGWQKVLDNEVRSIHRACQELYGHNPLPKICFIIVKRSHQTRFFHYDQQTNETKNIPPGTVVDTEIVSPNGFDFYLNAHQTIQGTAKPILYHVLYDQIGFTSDEIQQLTYYLCHTNVRCTRSVSIPAPVHYASLCVSRGPNLNYQEQMMNNEQRTDTSTDFDEEVVDENTSVSLDDVLTVKIDFHPTMTNSMWFA